MRRSATPRLRRRISSIERSMDSGSKNGSSSGMQNAPCRCDGLAERGSVNNRGAGKDHGHDDQRRVLRIDWTDPIGGSTVRKVTRTGGARSKLQSTHVQCISMPTATLPAMHPVKLMPNHRPLCQHPAS